MLGISVEELLEGKLKLLAESQELDDLQRLEHVYKYYSDDHRVNVGVQMFNSGNIEIGAPAFLFDRGRFTNLISRLS